LQPSGTVSFITVKQLMTSLPSCWKTLHEGFIHDDNVYIINSTNFSGLKQNFNLVNFII